MDRLMGGAVRSQGRGRRAQSMVQDRMSRIAAVRTVAGAATLALLALAAISTLGGAQAPRRDSSGWARTPRVIARTLGDTIADRRDERRGEPSDSAPLLDAATIASSVRAMADSVTRATPLVPAYRSRSDSIASVRTRVAADRERDLRIVISLNDRQLWALIGPDTLLRAPVAVSTDETLEYAGKTWRFETPRGVRTVIGKRENPVWIPPEWHYAEVAREHSLKLEVMKPGKTMLSDGRALEVRNGEVGVVDQSGEFALLPTDEEIIFDSTLFVPPVGSVNRRIEGELGAHMLDTGNGFLLHGTPHKTTIGTAATHGCIRLRDEDIEWLYDMMPVGTKVYIY
jgi:lipoprotein-anchoring transpeptidase ErfK/SrfK